MLDVVVVGAGLFGQIIARALEKQGRVVAIIDAKYELAGSKPAACLMKPSWFSGLGKEIYEPSLALLDDLYGVHDLEFDLRATKDLGRVKMGTVHWVDPARVLYPKANYAVVTKVEPGRVWSEGKCLEARLVVVAAGIWTQALLPQYKQIAQRGTAFLFDRLKMLERPFIQPYAPYKQLVAFNRGDGVWVGDGTAIKRDNWTDAHTERSRRRCAEAIDAPEHMCTELSGIRPYAKGHKPCLLEEVFPGLWVASGGAKNGTLSAGWCAHVIKERTS
jgi:glycine/D-amino acid oxidase-like deaminating enzyme